MKTFVAILALFLLHSCVQADGVTQCYNCNGYCRSKTIEDLPGRMLSSIEKCPTNYGYETVCISSSFVAGGRTFKAKSCNVNSPHTQMNCQSIRARGGSCYICTEDLCNEGW